MYVSAILCAGWIILCLGIVNSVELPDFPCDTNVYLEVGKRGIVPCRFQSFDLLGWINGDGSYGESVPFIFLENSEIHGRGYESGDYNMLPDGSLIINNVQFKHEFNFTVSYTPTVGKHMQFFVPVKVFVRPSPEYPVVNGLSNQQYIYQEVEFYSGSINCTMNGVRPGVDLEWVYQSDVISMENEPSSTVSNTDGTYNTSLSSRYTIRDLSVLKITLQCRLAGEMADLFPSVTTINLLNLNRIVLIPVIDGCYSQQEDCNLMMPRNGTLACSLLHVPLENRTDISLDISADASGLSLTRIKDHHHPHTSGDMYDLTTSYWYTVDEGSTESVIKCSLSVMNNQPMDSMTTARIIWQDNLYKHKSITGSAPGGGDSNKGWMFVSIILIAFVAFLIIIIIIIVVIIVKFKKELKPQTNSGIEMKARRDEGTQESGTLLEDQTPRTETDFETKFLHITDLLEERIQRRENDFETKFLQIISLVEEHTQRRERDFETKILHITDCLEEHTQRKEKDFETKFLHITDLLEEQIERREKDFRGMFFHIIQLVMQQSQRRETDLGGQLHIDKPLHRRTNSSLA